MQHQDPLKSASPADYEIPNHVWTEQLAPDYPTIQLSNSHGTATLALHGAHVIDYTPKNQEPVLFTSKQAVFKEGKAIRGGIPICWPWFNAHPSDSSLPSHGYARTQFWNISSSEHTADHTSITLTLETETLQAQVTITLSESLEISLKTTNTSNQTQTIGGALHSYFRISDILNTTITGLDNTHFIDTLTDTPESQSGDISITEETDRIYENTSATVSIFDSKLNRNIIIDKTGSKSTVVWNPWIEKSASMGDLGNEEYKEFICIEAANAREDVHQIAPRDSHTLSTKITSV